MKTRSFLGIIVILVAFAYPIYLWMDVYFDHKKASKINDSSKAELYLENDSLHTQIQELTDTIEDLRDEVEGFKTYKSNLKVTYKFKEIYVNSYQGGHFHPEITVTEVFYSPDSVRFENSMAFERDLENGGWYYPKSHNNRGSYLFSLDPGEPLFIKFEQIKNEFYRKFYIKTPEDIKEYEIIYKKPLRSNLDSMSVFELPIEELSTQFNWRRDYFPKFVLRLED